MNKYFSDKFIYGIKMKIIAFKAPWTINIAVGRSSK